MYKCRVSTFILIISILITAALTGCNSQNTTKVLSTGSSMDSTISWAHQIKNSIQTYFTDKTRGKVLVRNMNIEMIYDLQGEGNKQVEYIKVVGEKIPVLNNTMDIVMVDSNEKKYRTSISQALGRMNIYRHGLYYYDIHLMDLEPAAEDQTAKPVERLVFDFNIDAEGWKAINSLSSLSVNDGFVHTEITGADPYMVVSGLQLDADIHSSIEVTMKLDEGTSGQIFFATEKSPQMSESKSKHFSIVGDGKFHTYLIDMRGIEEWKGTITSLRLDIDDGTIGNEICIDSIKVLDRNNALLPFKLETIYHVYPERIFQEIILHSTGEAEVKDIYLEAKIDEDKIKKSSLKAANTIYGQVEEYKGSDIEWVGFYGKDIGTFGFIYPNVENNGEVVITSENDYYIIKHFPNLNKTRFKTGEKIIFGQRIFCENGNALDELNIQAEIENNPLNDNQIKVFSEKKDYAKYEGYQPLKGYYQFAGEGLNFNIAYYNYPNKYPGFRIKFQNDQFDRKLYVKHYAHFSAGQVEGAMLIDEEGYPVPVPIEVSKNFIDGYEDSMYYPDDKPFSESYFPIVLNSKESLELTTLHLYQNWGKYPLKQISSIRFFTPYYHLSTGVTETTCWAPFLFLGRNGFLITDFRPMSGIMWTGQPQHDTSGEHRLFHYKADDTWQHMHYKGTMLNSTGPAYSDMDLFFTTTDKKTDIKVNTVEMPQNDENRVFTRMEIEFLDDITIENPAQNLKFYSLKSSNTNTHYRKLSYLDQNNNPVEHKINFEGNKFEVYPLGAEFPFWAVYDIDKDKSMMNFMTNISIIVLDTDITIGGKPYEGTLAVALEKMGNGHILASLTLPMDKVIFKKGDRISLKTILMPYGSYKVADFEPVMNVRKEYGLNNVQVAAEKGKVLSEFPPTVEQEYGEAIFSIKGGYNNMTMKIEGFKDYTPPKVYEYICGEWNELEFSIKGHDGYQVYVDGKGKYGFAFIIHTDGSNHRYKVAQ